MLNLRFLQGSREATKQLSQNFSGSNGPKYLLEATVFVVSKQCCVNLDTLEAETVFLLLPGTASFVEELSFRNPAHISGSSGSTLQISLQPSNCGTKAGISAAAAATKYLILPCSSHC